MKADTMKAQVFRQPDDVEDKPLTLEDRPVPEPAAGEVRLRVQFCGVCRTDLHIAEGEVEAGKDDLIPGHQVVGEVESLGEGVTEIEEGDRVGVTWLFHACGECDACRKGMENLCENAQFTGKDRDGGYAEFMTIPAAYARKLPDRVEGIQAAPLLCAGVIGYRSLRLSGIERGQRLGLYGFGGSAHIAIQVARHWDCKVYVYTRSDNHRRHAEELGAAWVGGSEDDPPEKMDASVIFAPAGKIVHDALRHLAPGGTVAINAIHMSPIPETPFDLIYHERTLRSVANLTREDAKGLLKLAAEIPIETDTVEFPLEEANEALIGLKKSEFNGAAVLRVG